MSFHGCFLNLWKVVMSFHVCFQNLREVVVSFHGCFLNLWKVVVSFHGCFQNLWKGDSGTNHGVVGKVRGFAAQIRAFPGRSDFQRRAIVTPKDWRFRRFREWEGFGGRLSLAKHPCFHAPYSSSIG